MKILVYSDRITPRVEYIFKRIFEYFFASEIKFTSSPEDFEKSENIKINYSLKTFENSITFRPCELLFENEIRHIKPDLSIYEGLPVLFPCPEGGVLPFDPFGASFFLLSRYEEYLPFEPDKHGRFEASNSFLAETSFIAKPLADHYALLVGKILSKYSNINFENQCKYKFIPTFDIDIAFAFLGRSFGRNLGGFCKSLLTGKFGEIYKRIMVLTGRQDDPFDTYLHMRRIHKSLAIPPIYFINTGSYSMYDKNIPYYKPLFHTIVGKLAQYGGIGIHPSYFSNDEPAYFEEELYRLEKITGWKVIRSRQHYLRLYLPDTYYLLMKEKIEEDYTMGYSEQPGFRAGTCHPFYFFDLKTNEATKLKVFPFTVMDGTLRDYLNLSPEKATATINSLIDEVKKVNGCFISLWHNESLSEYKRWIGWNSVYEDLLAKAGGIIINKDK